MFDTEPVLTPEEIAGADNLDVLYERYVEAGEEPGSVVTDHVMSLRGSYDRDAVRRQQAYQKASVDYWEQVRDDVDPVEELAHEQYQHDETVIDLVGVVHGHDKLGPVPLYHDMNDVVKEDVQAVLDTILEEGDVFYEEGLDARLTDEQQYNSDVRGFWDVRHTVDGDGEAEQAAQAYMLKDIASIPFAKLVGRLSYDFSRRGLDCMQTAEWARTDPERQQDALNMIKADSLPVHLEEEYLSIVDPGQESVLTGRSRYMADRLAEAAEQADNDRIGAFVGLGHLNEIGRYLNAR